MTKLGLGGAVRPDPNLMHVECSRSSMRDQFPPFLTPVTLIDFQHGIKSPIACREIWGK
jgi:hypothetical protein